MLHVSKETSHVLVRLWLEKKKTVSLRTISHVETSSASSSCKGSTCLLLPFNYSHEKQWPTRCEKSPHHRPPQCSSKQNFREIDQQTQLRGTCHSLPSLRQKDALRIQTSHVSFRLHAIPGTTCPGLYGSSIWQEEGNCVAGSKKPDDKQRAITHVVFTRAVCLLVFRRLTFDLQLWTSPTQAAGHHACTYKYCAGQTFPASLQLFDSFRLFAPSINSSRIRTRFASLSSQSQSSGNGKTTLDDRRDCSSTAGPAHGPSTAQVELGHINTKERTQARKKKRTGARVSEDRSRI